MNPSSNPGSLSEIVRAERELACEQITAAWQIHVERVKNELEVGWREHVARALEDRFATLEQTVDDELKRRIAASVAEAVIRATDEARARAREESERAAEEAEARSKEEAGKAAAEAEAKAREEAQKATEAALAAAKEEAQRALEEAVARAKEEAERVKEEAVRQATEAAALEAEASAARLREEGERTAGAALTSAVNDAAAHARRSVSERLNQIVRRIEQAEDIQSWTAAVLDGASGFARRVALFSVGGSSLRHEGHRAQADANADGLAGMSVKFDAAQAFAGAVETLDTVIAEATAGQLSKGIVKALAMKPEARVFLLPILTGRGDAKRRAAAVLYAEPGDEPLNLDAVEVIAAVAGTTLESRFRAPAGAVPAESLVAVQTGPGAQPEQPPEVPQESRDVHIQAQRFARIRVAEMRLYHPKQVKEGREAGKIYELLREQIDIYRDEYAKSFLASGPAVDYLHAELVHTLANDDPSRMGSEYPGPLV